MTERVALYARLSQDSSGNAIKVRDQIERGRALAAARGYLVVGEFSDHDISAFRGQHRPEYEQVLRLARAQKIDRVVVFHLTRITRNRKERAEFIDDFALHGVNVSETGGQDLDLGTASGRTMADVQGVMATWESEVKSERVTAACERRAKAGAPNGRLGFGWTKQPDGTFVIEPGEAAIVREIVSRLSTGETLRGVTDDLNARKVPAPNSESWGKTSVKKIATRPANIAKRVHHRGRDDEALFAGTWPPLVPEKHHAKVIALLTDPARRTATVARPGARRHLLSWGIGECGICRGKLRVALRGSSRYGQKKLLYVCDGQGCVGRNEAAVDGLMAEVIIGRLAMPDALDWLMGDDEAAKAAGERAADLQARLDEATDMLADGIIDRQQMTRLTERIRPQLDAAEAERQRHLDSTDLDTLAQLAGPKARARWEEMTVTQRRLVAGVLFERVVVNRVTRRGPGFDPESVQIVWRRA